MLRHAIYYLFFILIAYFVPDRYAFISNEYYIMYLGNDL